MVVEVGFNGSMEERKEGLGRELYRREKEGGGRVKGFNQGGGKMEGGRGGRMKTSS